MLRGKKHLLRLLILVCFRSRLFAILAVYFWNSVYKIGGGFPLANIEYNTRH